MSLHILVAINVNQSPFDDSIPWMYRNMKVVCPITKATSDGYASLSDTTITVSACSCTYTFMHFMLQLIKPSWVTVPWELWCSSHNNLLSGIFPDVLWLAKSVREYGTVQSGDPLILTEQLPKSSYHPGFTNKILPTLQIHAAIPYCSPAHVSTSKLFILSRFKMAACTKATCMSISAKIKTKECKTVTNKISLLSFYTIHTPKVLQPLSSWRKAKRRWRWKKFKFHPLWFSHLYNG